MGVARVQIQIVPEIQFPRYINIVMSRLLAKKLEIETNPFLVTFGSATAKGAIAFTNKKNNLVRMSSRLASQLKMINQSLIQAQFDSRSLRLRFGPLLGILINAEPQGKQEQLFGLMTRFLEECSAAGQSQGIRVAVFSPEQIDLKSKEIGAWVREKGRWTFARLPLPDVIYNRITSRKLEQQEGIQNKLYLLKTYYHIPIFNEKFLNKYQVYQILIKDERARNMLPETYPFRISSFKELLQRYPTVYLKPNNGSLGSGIIKVSRSDGKWICQSATPSGTLARTTKTLAEMSKLMAQKIGRQSYLVQQGLSLVKYDDRQMDFRVLVQKNRNGDWRVTSSVARIANNQHIVSNLARGGTIRKAADVLKELNHIPGKPTDSDIKTTALEIAKTFEHLAEGHFAELGIDLALDTKGKIWLIEINSKPSKTDDTVINPTTNTRPSVLRLIDYVHFLTETAGGTHSPPFSPNSVRKIRGRGPI
jgi:glutathione synthase/RimK-type ligase-like ATP-grasp enzyme